MSNFDIKYMEKALELARAAFEDNEDTVGAVIVFTLKQMLLTMPERLSAAGGYGIVKFM